MEDFKVQYMRADGYMDELKAMDFKSSAKCKQTSNELITMRGSERNEIKENLL